MKISNTEDSQLLNVSQRILATLEGGKLINIKLVSDQGYVVTSENAEYMLPMLVGLYLPNNTLITK